VNGTAVTALGENGKCICNYVDMFFTGTDSCRDAPLSPFIPSGDHDAACDLHPRTAALSKYFSKIQVPMVCMSMVNVNYTNSKYFLIFRVQGPIEVSTWRGW